MEDLKQMTPPTIEEQLAALTAALAEQKAISEKQQEVIASLQTKETVIATKAKAKPTIPTEKVVSKGKNYKWNVPHFRFGSDAVITAEDAATDSELVAKIIATPGQGILSQIF
jgi:hypothetical protein